MPYNPSGVYSLPAGSLVANGDTSDAPTQHNAPLADITQAINEITGGTQEFIGPVAAPNGTALLPAFTFASDPNTGIYRTAADSIGFTTGGTLRLTLSTTALTSTLPFSGTTATLTGILTVPAGSAAAPAITTTGDTNTGILFPAADQVAIATGGTQRLLVTDGYMNFNGGSVLRDGYARGTTTFYTSSGALTVSARCRALEVEILAGGGGGGGVDGAGGSTTALAGSGGGGGYQKIFYTNMAQTFTMTIGAGGAGGAAGNNAGTQGGTTTFAASVDGNATASGGQGGAGKLADTGTDYTQGAEGGSSGAAASPGGTSRPILNVSGERAGISIKLPSRQIASRAGGNFLFKSLNAGLTTDGDGADADAFEYGCGGAGASVASVTTNYAGGDGGGGCIIVTEYF